MNNHKSNREGMETVRCPSVRGFKSHPPHQNVVCNMRYQILEQN